MPYKTAYRSIFMRDLKRITPDQKQELYDAIDQIMENPLCGEEMKGNLKGMKKMAFNRRPEMRLLYAFYSCQEKDKNTVGCHYQEIDHSFEELKSCQGLIIFIYVRTREACNNLYNISRKDILKQLR